MDIERVSAISPERFERDYLRVNHPVVVTDALAGWDLAGRWTPGYLRQEFGDERVQVYNNYFDLQSMRPLGEYLDEYFGKDTNDATELPYVRWYTKLRDVRFLWADKAFKRFAGNWTPPYFLPTSDYVLPFSPGRTDPRHVHFPAKGLFISPKGGRTGLHVDPWGSDAVLCQLFGDKHWTMYHPDEARYLRNDGVVVDPDRPDHDRFPEFRKARVTYDFVLRPGETVLVPHGWYHAVKTLTDSISLTWNFVHRSTSAALLAWLRQPMSEIDQSVLRFFFGPVVGDDVTPAAIEALLARAPRQVEPHAAAIADE